MAKLSSFDKAFEEVFASLEAKLAKIQSKIQVVIQQSVINPASSNVYWNGVRKELDTLYKEMTTVFSSWAESEIPRRFSKSIRNMMSYINSNKVILEKAAVPYARFMHNQSVNNVASILYQDAVTSFASAAEAGKNNMYRLTRMTQQRLINESFIDLEVAQAAEAGTFNLAMKEIQTALEYALWEAVKNKQFVQAGRYKYRPEYYAHMVARTKFHEAQAQAALLTASNYGTDLVQVSIHNTTTAICVPFEGRIFSVSGNNKAFPPIEDTPPFHPNCLHLLYPYFESALEATGTYQEWSDFSWGETDTPPNMPGFVPISERVLV